jgi:ribosome biogenesis GTPase
MNVPACGKVRQRDIDPPQAIRQQYPMAKRNKTARIKNWESTPEADYSHERKRFRGKDPRVPKTVTDREYFSDIQPNAIVVSPYGALAFVNHDGMEFLSRASEVLMDGKNSVLAPGDRVLISFDEDPPLITACAHRRSKLSRPSIGKGKEQFIAANVDLLVVVATAAQPVFKQGIVDRYMIAAQVGGVETVLCMNKTDLPANLPDAVEEYERLGLPVVYTSCERRTGLDRLRNHLRGKLSVMAGQSGVGKSSLIMALNPHLDLDVQEVSRANEKGQHTTTTSRLYEFQDVRIIDTPGIRQLGLWGVSLEELSYYFPDMATLASQCKFRDCTHTHEPNCAVKQAAEDGNLSQLRYTSYVRIRSSIVDENARKRL